MGGFLIKQGFSHGKVDTTLFIRRKSKPLILVQIHVYDIIFGSINESLFKEFASSMHEEFEMSLMGELAYFLGLQIMKAEEGNFISQTKYFLELLKNFDMEYSISISTYMQSIVLIEKDEK